MSVYSGFSTRKLETMYGKLTAELISLLVRKVVSTLDYSELPDLEWHHKFNSVCRQMHQLEAKKYHPPKFSPLCREVHDFYKESQQRYHFQFEPVPISYMLKPGSLQMTPDRSSNQSAHSSERFRLQSSIPVEFTRKRRSYRMKSKRRLLSIPHQSDSLKEKVLQHVFP